MTCHHKPGDPSCGSHPSNVARAAHESQEYERSKLKEEHQKEIARLKAMIPPSPDANNYSIEEVEAVGSHLVMRVKYPSCDRCAYEGNKVMVFLDVATLDALKWRRIDPHFRDPKAALSPKEAPPPAARFPANNKGWREALSYARSVPRAVPQGVK